MSTDEQQILCDECGRVRCLIDGLCDDCTIAKHGCLFPPEMPDCQDLRLYKFSERTKALAEDRGNSACGDVRMFKAGYVRVAIMNAIHHEARSAYLAGYLQATKDLQE